MRIRNGFLWALVAILSIPWVGPGESAAEVAKPKVIYPEKTTLDFEGLQIQGELRTPGEFYFRRKPEEKFDSLVKRRRNFHREMLRDVVSSR
jgi:hypothetical protein